MGISSNTFELSVDMSVSPLVHDLFQDKDYDVISISCTVQYLALKKMPLKILMY